MYVYIYSLFLIASVYEYIHRQNVSSGTTAGAVDVVAQDWVAINSKGVGLW